MLGASCSPGSAAQPSAAQPGKASEALVVGPQLPPGGPDEDEEDEVDDLLLREGYVYPRAFPATEVSQDDRNDALAELATLSDEQGFVQYDPATDTCGGKCTESQACVSTFCAEPCATVGTECQPGTMQQRGPSGCFCVPEGGGTGNPPAPASGCAWLPVGPTNISGRVYDFAFDPVDSNRLIAASVGGVWLSPDKGRSWQRAVVGKPGVQTSRATVASSLSFNTQTHELFVATGDRVREFGGDGIWMSEPATPLLAGDSGTWTKITDAELDGVPIFRVRAQPTAGGSVYAATKQGLYLGTRSPGPGGTDWTWSWKLLGAPSDPMDGDVDDVLVDFGSQPPAVWAAVKHKLATKDAGLYAFSPDGSWSPINGGISDPPQLAARMRLAMARNAGPLTGTSTLYARLNFENAQQLALFKKLNTDASWQKLPLTTPDRSDGLIFGGAAPQFITLEVAPDNPNLVYVGGNSGLWASPADGSFVWHNIAQHGAGVAPHIDFDALAFDPANRRVLYVGSDGGVFKSNDTSTADWTWFERAHGLVNTELYRASVQQGGLGQIASGMQDNGFATTFGNRTWYGYPQCDGIDVAIGAPPVDLIYGGCQSATLVYTSLLPSRGIANIPVSVSVTPPTVDFAGATFDATARVTNDPVIAGVALARGVGKADPTQEYILKTDNVVSWQAQSPVLPPGGKITAMAISGATQANLGKYYYVAVQPPAAGAAAQIFVSPDAGATWSATPENAGVAWVNSIAIDSDDPRVAWLASRDGLVRQRVSQGAWTATAPASSSQKLPDKAAVTALVAAPLAFTGFRALYAATSVGVFQGSLFQDGTIGWTRFDYGLPEGVDVNDLRLDVAGRAMVAATWGHGAFRYAFPPVGAEGSCSGVSLVVRDNVYDRGQEPSPNGVPDPEWPIQITKDPAHATEFPNRPTDFDGFFKPNDSADGKLYFWESTDIRVEVPSKHDATAHSCPAGETCPLDSVEFDSCPRQVGSCPNWMLHDMNPLRSQPAPAPATITNFYVQVANNGVGTAHKVRVVSLLAAASAGVPHLPATYWSSFHAGGGCDTVPATVGEWQVVGCKVIDHIGPFRPEVAQFPYAVPSGQAQHSCMMALVDSPDDKLSESTQEIDLEARARNDRHVAQRNLQIEDGPSVEYGGSPGVVSASLANGIPFSGLETLKVPNRWAPNGQHQVMFGKSDMSPTGRLAFLLPAGKTAPNLPPSCGASSNSASAVAISLPKGLLGTDLALGAGGTLDFADRAVIVNDAPIANAGSGQLSVGAHAKTGTVWSAGNVLLRSASTVTGDVNVGAMLTRQDGTTITGDVKYTSSLSPADAFSWSVTWPATSRGSRDVQGGQTDVEAPGRLGAVSVKANGTLKLSSGVYYVDSLTFDALSRLLLDQSAGPITVYTRGGFTFRGSEQTTSGAPADLLLVAIGTTPIPVETSFTGTVVAPSATLTLGSNGGSFVGSFYAHDIAVRADVTIQQRTSTAWAKLPACRALTPSEQATAAAAGLSPTLYPVNGTSLVQKLPIPYNQTWTLGVRFDSGLQRMGSATRFRVIALDPQGQVMAGNTYLLRQ